MNKNTEAENIEYFQNKLFTAAKVPKSYGHSIVYPSTLTLTIKGEKHRILKIKEFLAQKNTIYINVQTTPKVTVNRPYLAQDDIQGIWTQIIKESNKK